MQKNYADILEPRCSSFQCNNYNSSSSILLNLNNAHPCMTPKIPSQLSIQNCTNMLFNKSTYNAANLHHVNTAYTNRYCFLYKLT